MRLLKKLKDWAWVAVAVVLQIPLPWEGTPKKKRPARKHKAHRE
jgi:hypothetical protein